MNNLIQKKRLFQVFC